MGVSTAPEQHRRGLSCRWEPLDVEAVAPATSVAVMAPALTESGPQKPDDLLPPLPTSGFLTQEQAAQVCQNREVLAKFVVSANVQPTKIDDQCLRGISKDLIRDVINSKYGNGLDSLSTLANDTHLIVSKLAEEEEEEEEEIEEEEEEGVTEVKQEKDHLNHQHHIEFDEVKHPALPDCNIKELSDAIMSDPSAGDQNDEMGFIKTSKVVPMLPMISTDNSDAKDLIDVDHMMELNADLPSNVGDIGQNDEDILQAIKSFEGAAASLDTGDTMIPGETSDTGVNEMFAMTDGFSSFERELLSDVDVDVMSLVNDNMSMSINESVETQRDNNLRIQQESVELKQYETEKRCAFLMRRLRKLQARLVGRHVAEENTGVLELAHHSVKKYFLQELSNITGTKGGGNTARNFPEIGGNLNTFLQKIEKSCIAQSNSVNRQRMCCRYFGAGSRDNATSGVGGTSSGNRHPVFGTAQVKLDREEVENVAGSLATQLHTLELNLDSDCTASSSGGESCDEMQNYNNPHQQKLPISKRAAWKYAQERAGVASRWTWLQAQIADLEYRIRQHNDLQRQVRSSKGLVVLENSESINGYSGLLPGSTGRFNATDNEQSASRTRPFVWELYRKRKLLRLDGLHEYSKRAAKASTIRCDCNHILPPCALCTGRTDPTQPQEPLEQLSISERIALADPSYHSVLSFPDEIVYGTHFDAIMKSTEWQQKMLRGNVRMPRTKDKDMTEKRNKTKLPEHRVKYTPRSKKSSTNILTARIKRKMLNKKTDHVGQGRNIHGISRKRVKVTQPIEGDEDASTISGSSKHSSPVPSPLQHTTTNIEKVPPKDKTSNSHVRLRQNSYDIDNIVIPYSVAASTRLEKLQYKEILTPKWRLCAEHAKAEKEIKNGVMHRPSQDSDCEDVSEEAISLRHERSEREENKRFMTYANILPQSRIRHNRRVDSRADSGANTPDPMSPHASDFSGDVTSPITSPPATPLCTQDTDHQNTLDGHRNSSLQNAIRRRTFSSSMRIGRDESGGLLTEEDQEVLPYDPRVFPLPEEVYDKMLEVMPDGHWQASSGSLCAPEEEKPDDFREAEVESPGSDTTESAYCDADGEDPNDPEWTVAEGRDAEKERIRPTAKR